MGLFGFGNKKEGGILDVIRCDENEYLVWKWSPNGETSRKENAIRYGSSLRVQAGQVAVFVYRQKDGSMMDYIVGPYDQTIKTANFPVLSSIVGTAFGGASPFQAEIYFINLKNNINMKFFVDEFHIEDPNGLITPQYTREKTVVNFSIPATVKGTMSFKISDYKKFVSCNSLRQFDVQDLQNNIKDFVVGIVKSTVASAPADYKIDFTSLSAKAHVLSKKILSDLKVELDDGFGISVDKFEITNIDLNKNSEEFKRWDLLKQSRINSALKMDIDDSTHYSNETRRADELQGVQIQEMQRRQKLDTETAYLGAHQLNIQGDVAKTAAESLGMMNANMGFGDGGGMNPAGMMTGMMMGGAVGGGMANMMGNMMQGMNQAQPPAPPTGAIAQYHVVINGQQSGPYNMAQLQQLVQNGQLAPNTYVWKQGMSGWDFASNVPELRSLFGAVPPPPPPVM